METVKGIMIGDWLDYFDVNDGQNHPSQVIGITYDGYCGERLKIVPHYDPGDELDANIRWFFPIHLSRDILEANGITPLLPRYPSGGLTDFVTHPLTGAPTEPLSSEAWRICDDNYRTAFLFHNLLSGMWYINGLEAYTILYVHQLQHALQAISIEKDIIVKSK